MAFDVSGLQDKINYYRGEIFFYSGDHSDTMSIINGSVGSGTMPITVATGIKGNNLVLTTGDVPLTLRDADCDFVAGPNDTFGEISVPLKDLEANKEWCIRDLENKVTNQFLTPGQHYEDLELAERMILNELSLELGNQIENLLWNGDHATAGEAQGWATVIKSDPTQLAGGGYSGTTALDETTIIAAIDDMIERGNADKNFAQAMGRSQVSLWLGQDKWWSYVQARKAAGASGYIHQPTMNDMMIEGTGLNVRRVSGLHGKNEMYMTIDGNLFFGTDLLSDQGEWELGMDQYNKKTWAWNQFKQGCGVFHKASIVAHVGP